MIAEGIIHVVKERKIKIPVVVRLEGTHVKEGEKLLEDSGLEIIAAVDLLDAAKKIVSQVQEVI
jgi:succinyl-CoA synthetase beta subunit